MRRDKNPVIQVLGLEGALSIQQFFRHGKWPLSPLRCSWHLTRQVDRVGRAAPRKRIPRFSRCWLARRTIRSVPYCVPDRLRDLAPELAIIVITNPRIQQVQNARL